jgi:hypothetical protein
MAEAATEVVTAEAVKEVVTAEAATEVVAIRVEVEKVEGEQVTAKEEVSMGEATEVEMAAAKEVVRAETMAVEVRSMQICLHCQQTPNSMFAFVGCDVVLHYPPVFDSSRN